MADCHSEFLTFYENIALPEGKRQSLRDSRETVRERIRKHFKEEREEPIPKFLGQGSYATHSIINPLDGEYDIDDGVYLLDNLPDDRGDWPAPATVHRWIYDAVEGHTSETIDKRTCVRVVYAGDYHVDLPIYGEDQEDYYLAERGEKGWHISDPQKLREWFSGEVKAKGDQLRRVVRYFKAWADFQSNKQGALPSGLIFTVLASEQFQQRDRDDVAFARVARRMYARSLAVPLIVRNPVDDDEDLAENLTDSEKERFQKLLSQLTNKATEALDTDNKSDACEAWRNQFGERFPECEEEEKEKDEALETSSPAILRDDARSA